jgi:serine/threonine-protein phosphatase 2B catalytic subunit
MDSFDSMPLACLINEKYLGVHGGISPELKKIDMINKVKRFWETPLDGLFCDLLWADPLDDETAGNYDFMDNEEWECSFVFGKKPCWKVLEANNLMSIVRAH